MPITKRLKRFASLVAILVGTALVLDTVVFGIAPIDFYLYTMFGLFSTPVCFHPVFAVLSAAGTLLMLYWVAPWKHSWTIPIFWSLSGAISAFIAMTRSMIT